MKSKFIQYVLLGFLAIVAIQIIGSMILILLPMIGRAIIVVAFVATIYLVVTKVGKKLQ